MFKFLFISATTILCAVVLASGTSAAPLKNYDRGHFAIEVGGTLPTNLHFSDYGHPKKATSMYGGGTVGLGGQTAVNYRFNQFRTSGSEKITAQQVNLMYKVLPPVSVFAGYLNAKTTVDDAYQYIQFRAGRCAGQRRYSSALHSLGEGRCRK